MPVSATHIAVNLFRSHPLYAAKSINISSKQMDSEHLKEQESVIYRPNYDDSIAISEEYKSLIASENANRFLPKNLQEKDEKINSGKFEEKNKKDNKVDRESKGDKELSEEEKAVIENLEKRDAEVHQHEETHLAAGSGIVRGGASYTYQTGPDGKQYAIGGEVQIDMSPIDGDPEATIRKMQQVQRAALAPAEPSAQDYSVASSAKSNEAAARAEASSKNSEQSTATSSDVDTTNIPLDNKSIKALSLYQNNSSTEAETNSSLALKRIDARA